MNGGSNPRVYACALDSYNGGTHVDWFVKLLQGQKHLRAFMVSINVSSVE